MYDVQSNVDPRVLKKVVKTFRTEMELPTVAFEDDFFDLGGDSLMAESLINAINKEFGKSYDVSNILDYPTPMSMAKCVSKGRTFGDYITPTTESTGSEPLLFMHGAFGDNYHLRLFGEDVKSRWNIVGIRAKGFVLGESLHETLDELVRDYLKSVKDHLGKYPKLIVGNCGGGMIALQMAREIYNETGQRMNLVIIDPPGTFAKIHQQKQVRTESFRQKFNYTYSTFSRDILTKLGLGNSNEARRSRQYVIFRNLIKLMRQVYPEPFPINLLIFVGDKLMDVSVPGFQKWANEDVLLRFLPLPGRHNQIHEKNNKVIDAEIINFMDEMNAKELEANPQ